MKNTQNQRKNTNFPRKCTLFVWFNLEKRLNYKKISKQTNGCKGMEILVKRFFFGEGADRIGTDAGDIRATLLSMLAKIEEKSF